MIQKIIDNLSRTKRLLGRFILSQIGELYEVQKAVKVMGEAYINQNFQKPKLMPGPMGQQVPMVDPTTMQPVMELDKEAVATTFDTVLKDAQVGEYDVSIGEAANSETVKYANYMMLMDMQKQGIPIDPAIILDESLLSTASKEKAKAAIQRMQAAQAAAPKKAA